MLKPAEAQLTGHQLCDASGLTGWGAKSSVNPGRTYGRCMGKVWEKYGKSLANHQTLGVMGFLWNI
jgi:hypothetical protein